MMMMQYTVVIVELDNQLQKLSLSKGVTQLKKKNLNMALPVK